MKNRCKDMTFMLYSITFTKKNHKINTALSFKISLLT